MVTEITDEFNDIDEAMRLGFNWSKGPFEMLEEIGVENFFSKIDNYDGNKFLENMQNVQLVQIKLILVSIKIQMDF